MKSESKKGNIFIVEDEIVVANDIKNILSAQDINVVGIATKYEQAKAKILLTKPDVVLCDINLREEKTGIDLIGELLENMFFKIIFITAYSDINTIKQANLLNPFHYIIKPFTDQQLITSVRMALLSLNGDSDNTSKPTKREVEIIRFLTQGYNNYQIGEKLKISPNTVKTHRSNLLQKLNIKSVAELVALSVHNGWVR